MADRIRPSCIYFLILLYFHFEIAKTANSVNIELVAGNNQSKSNLEGDISEIKTPQPPYVQIPPPSTLFQTQPTKLRQDFSTLPVVVNADRVSRLLRKLANEDMGVYAMQQILDGMLYRSDQFDHAESVKKMAETVGSRLEEVSKAVHEIQRSVLALFSRAPIDMQIFRQYRECCTLDKKLLTYSARFSSRINRSLTCDVLPQRRFSAFSFYPGKNLSSVFAKNSDRDSGIRWQYFITADGIHTEYPAHQFDDRQNFSRCLYKASHRRWNTFMAAALPFPKTVIIIIDRGSGVSPAQLETGKCVAKSLIYSLNDKDRVAVMAVGGSVSYYSQCVQYDQQARFPFASQATKTRLAYFLDSLNRDNDRTNHTQAFESAFELYSQLLASYAESGLHHSVFPTIVYISRGLLTEITEAKQVLSTIMNGINRIDGAVNEITSGRSASSTNPVQINTVALLEPGKLVMWETQFLQDVASQNFSKHKLALDSKPNSIVGKMMTVNATSNAELACVSLTDAVVLLTHNSYDRWSTANNDDGVSGASGIQIVLTDDPFEAAYVSVAIDVHFEGRFVGVAGVDVALSDLMSPAIYYTSADTSAYAAVLDMNGLVIYHPKLQLDETRLRAGSITAAPLSWFEDWPKHYNYETASELEHAMVNQWYGFFDLDFDDSTNISKPDVNYFWHKTSNRFLTFIIIASEGSPNSNRKSGRHDARIYVQHALSYHRLDYRLNKDVRLCYHGKSLASFERAGIFLSPRAFDRAYDRRLVPETKQSAQGYWAYTTDDTRLITNPGLKHGVRHEVGAFSKIAYDWKKQAEKSGYRLSIVRRYLATPSGVLLTYPAAVTDQNYDPITSDWYRNAIQNPGRVVLSEARLDPHGFGNLVTISHTVYEGKAAMHQPGDAVVAVMAVDVPLTFVYKLLYDSLSICRESGIDCFLFNEYGYVVANKHAFTIDDQLPSANGPQQNGQSQQTPVEVMHIAHREPSVASEILQRKGFAVKMTCSRFGDRTVQRYYVFNTSFADVLRSSDGCIRYQVAAVPQTNVFLAVVNKSCHRHSSFCPCSVNDRRCLNCHRGTVEPAESWCECPCECPLNLLDEERWCRRQSTTARLELPNACRTPQLPERSTQLDAQFLSTVGSNLGPCLQIHCGNFDTESVCRGVMGCEWCSYDADGRSTLKAPYCTSLNSCFGGVQGLSAYSEEDVTYDPIAVPTPVGPVAGGIMGIFVLLVAGVYWYRHHVVRLVESRHGRYGSGGSASCLQRFDDSAEEGYHFDDGSGGSSGNGDDKGAMNGGNALLLASFERANMGIGRVIRPRYRPGPRTESSDPGYSTMTGNCDDSEQATTIEPYGTRRPTAKVSIRCPTILGHRSMSTTAASTCQPTNDVQKILATDSTPVDVVDSTIPGATILPNIGSTVLDPLLDNSMSENSSILPASTNIVTMALIHHPAVVETT